MALFGGETVVASPEGYCIDTRSSRDRRGFVVMAGCALVSSDPRMPLTDGLLTVQVGDAGTAIVDGGEETLREVLATAGGVALLSATGDPTDIEVDALDSRNGIVYVHFSDAGPPPAAGLENLEWRAFFDLGGRLATVSLRGFERAPIDSRAGLTLLLRATEIIRAANAA